VSPKKKWADLEALGAVGVRIGPGEVSGDGVIRQLWGGAESIGNGKGVWRAIEPAKMRLARKEMPERAGA
jgi:hypothetical protein